MNRYQHALVDAHAAVTLHNTVRSPRLFRALLSIMKETADGNMQVPDTMSALLYHVLPQVGTDLDAHARETLVYTMTECIRIRPHDPFPFSQITAEVVITFMHALRLMMRVHFRSMYDKADRMENAVANYPQMNIQEKRK